MKWVSWTTTHDTELHTQGTVNNKTKADLGLIKSMTAWDVSDSLAWYAGINSTFSMQDVWEMFRPYIKLLHFGLLFHFLTTVFFRFIVNVLFATSMAMWEQGWSVVSPITFGWGCFGFMMPSALSLARNTATDNRMPSNSTMHVVDGILGVFVAMASIGSMEFPSGHWAIMWGTLLPAWTTRRLGSMSCNTSAWESSSIIFTCLDWQILTRS